MSSLPIKIVGFFMWKHHKKYNLVTLGFFHEDICTVDYDKDSLFVFLC